MFWSMSEYLRISCHMCLSSMGGVQRLTLLALATMVNTHNDESVNKIDLTTLVMNGEMSPKLYQVIKEDNDRNLSVEQGWRMMKEDNKLLNDVSFRDQFLYNTDIVQQFTDDEIAIIEGEVFST